MSMSQYGFFHMLLSDDQKKQIDIDKQLDDDNTNNRLEFHSNVISESGFDLDKTYPNSLKQFINAIDSLLKLKLSGVHSVALYGQRLDLTFNDRHDLISIKVVS